MATKDEEGIVRIGGDCNIALKIDGATVSILIKMDTIEEAKQLYALARETITDNGCLHVHFGVIEYMGRTN